MTEPVVAHLPVPAPETAKPGSSSTSKQGRTASATAPVVPTLVVIAALIMAMAAAPVVAAPGDPDTTFGANGASLTDFGPNEGGRGGDYGEAIAVDGTGRVLMAGWSSGPVGGGIAVARYLGDGALDVSFGHNGRVIVVPGPSSHSFDQVGLAISSDGRIIVVSNYDNAMLAVRLRDDGSLDSSFDADGIAVLRIGTNVWADEVALDEAGRIVLVGGSLEIETVGATGTSQYDIAVARLTAGGTLDPTFATGGVAILDRGQVDFGRAVGTTAGKIVVAGGSAPLGSSDSDFLVARFNEDGTLDAAFGTGGITVTDLGSPYDNAEALAFAATGEVTIGGATGSPVNLGLARYDTTGQLDAAFGGDGIVITDAGPSPGFAEGIRDLAIDTSNRVVGAAWAHPGDSYDGIAVRYLADGSLDTSFAGDGIAELGLITEDRAEAVALDGSDVLIGGWQYSASDPDFRVTRLDSSGALDPSFGGTGTVVTDMGPAHPRSDNAYEIANLPDGRLIAAGGTYDGASDVAIAMYGATGALDPSFDGDGRFRLSLGDYDEAYAIAVQPGLGIVAGGIVDQELFVLRLGLDGALDPLFGTAGIVRFRPGSYGYAWDLTVDAAGRIVVTGEQDGDVLVVRLESDGSLDPTFGSSGQVVVGLGRYAYGSSVTLDSSGRIVVAAEGGPSMDVIRLTSSGSLDTTFGGDGIATVDTPLHDQAMEAAVDGSGRILVVGKHYSTSGPASADNGMMLARLDDGGVLDPSFDGDGIRSVPISGSGNDQAAGVEVQPGGAIVVAGRVQTGNSFDMLVGRFRDDGALDMSFGNGGLVMTDLGGADQAWAVLLDAAGTIVTIGAGGRNGDFAVVRYDGSGGPPTPTATAPGAPTSVTAAAGDGQASVSWVAPASDGGSPITAYTVTSSPDGLIATTAGATSATVTGLSNGTPYTFTVTATNAIGTGPSSGSSDPVTPQAGAAAPQTTTETAPASTGGTATTDPTATGPTPSDPITTSVTVPPTSDGGTISIAETAVTQSAPAGGYQFFGQQIDITSSATTSPSNPLTIVFTIDSSAIRASLGLAPSDPLPPADQVSVTKAETGDPVVVAPCTTSTPPIDPDPCVSERQYINNGDDLRITILTGSASHWNTAVKPIAVTVTNNGYTPKAVTVAQGGIVVWTFSGTKSHSVTENLKLGPAKAPLFNSGVLTSGRYGYLFRAAATYTYGSTVKGDPGSFAGTVAVPVGINPASGGTATSFTITWSSATLTGYVFDVQYRFMKAGSKTWSPLKAWKTGVSTISDTFSPSSGKGTYAFSARLRNASSGLNAQWSPEATFIVR